MSAIFRGRGWGNREIRLNDPLPNPQPHSRFFLSLLVRKIKRRPVGNFSREGAKSRKGGEGSGPGCEISGPHDQGIFFREHPSKCQCRWACVESAQGWPCGDDPISRADDIIPVFYKNDISCWRGDVSPTDAAFLQNASIFAYADPGFHPGLVCAVPSGR